MKTNMSFTGDKGHNHKIIEKYNRIAKHFDVTELPDLLESWMDDTEMHDFATHLEERFYSNFNEYVIEYNIRSLCAEKAYSAVIIDKKEFGSDFEDFISHTTHEVKEDGSIYYLEKDLEGRRADKGDQGVLYDRAWVRSPKDGKQFLRYLESIL